MILLENLSTLMILCNFFSQFAFWIFWCVVSRNVQHAPVAEVAGRFQKIRHYHFEWSAATAFLKLVISWIIYAIISMYYTNKCLCDIRTLSCVHVVGLLEILSYLHSSTFSDKKPLMITRSQMVLPSRKHNNIFKQVD